MATSMDSKVMQIEQKFNIKGINSEENGLYYFFDDDKKGVGIMTFHDGKPTFVLMTKQQAKAVIQEFSDVCEMIFD